ncbi:MAG: hypothetical protein U0Q16_02125 [Bryobacteraceae bacterium]
MLRQISADPDNLILREEFARSLEGNDSVRAQFIRLQLRRSTASKSSTLEDLEAEWKCRDLEKLHGREWLPNDLAGLGVTGVRYNRGFPEHVEIDASDFLVHWEALLEAAPILHLTLKGVKAVAEALFTSPALRRMRSLDLSRCGLTDPEIELLASQPLVDLRWLSLAGNEIGKRGVEALVAATQSGRIPLVYVNLAGNPFNPVERLVYDMDSVMDTEMSPEALEWERRAPVPWLRRNLKNGLIQPIDRFAPERASSTSYSTR